ncbi:MAG: hypothetical protein WCN97_10650 [Thermoleophilia bacterium]
MAGALWRSALVVALVVLTVSSAHAGTVTGTLTDTNGPVVGKPVVVMDNGADNTFGTSDDRAVGSGVTAAGGAFTVTVPTGGGNPTANTDPVQVVAQEFGTTPVSQTITLSSGAGTTGTILLPVSGTTFSQLGIFGGQISRILAGGAPCEFYAVTSVIPQLFVTVDCGGNWSSVTTQTDSATLGLPANGSIDAANAATSGVAGEIAAIVSGRVYYSRNYGTTWSSVGGTALSGPSQSRYLYWGHVGTNDVVLVRDGANTYTADLNAATPTLIDMTTDYVGASTDGIAVANGATQPYVATASAFASNSTTVTIYPLQAGATRPSANATLAGTSVAVATPGATPVLGFGGTTATGPPDVLLVADLKSGNDPITVLADTADGATFTVGQTRSEVTTDCGSSMVGGVSEASVSRQSDPGGATGSMIGLARCSLQVTANFLTLTPKVGSVAGFAIDPGYDDALVGQVLIAPQGDRGIQKSSRRDGSNVPIWPIGPPFSDDAEPGTGATSDGIAVNGLTVPVVKEVAFGPNGATDVAVMFSTSGGGLCLASDDGLATTAHVKPVVGRGGRSVAWWSGTASQTWILCGHGDGTLSGVRNWTPATATVTSSIAVNGASTFRLDPSGGGSNGRIDAIAPIPSADAAFIGGKIGASPSVTGKIYREALAIAGGNVEFGAGAPAFALPEAVSRLRYCPAAGSAAGFQDVLFIGTYDPKTGDGGNATNLGGKVYRLANASTAANGATPVALTGSATTGVGGLDVNCASGVLFAGFRQENGTGASLQRSTDGTSLTDVTVAAGPALSVRSVAMNPSSPKEIVISSGADGFIYGSLDGGATWILANNATQFPGGVNFQSEGIPALAIPPGLVRQSLIAPRGGGFHNVVQNVYALAAVSSSSTVVGSGGGAYKSSLRSGLTSGGGGAGGGGGGSGGGASGGGAAAPSSGSSSTTGKATVTTRIAAAKWSAAKKTITANVTVQKAGKVTVTVSLKNGAKLTKVTTGSATVKKAGTSAAVFTVLKRLAKGSYVLTIAGGGTTSLTVR